MKKEYDFSQGERGKFYRPDLQLHMPVYLDSDVLSTLTERATARGMEVGELVNEILKKGIAFSDALR
jgi:hypothetical protein